MLLPEKMSRILIAGSKDKLKETTEVLYDLALVHPIDFSEEEGLSLGSGVAGIMGLLVAFALWWGYFEGAKGAAVRTLSAKKHVRRYQLWLYSHLPLLMGITATAVGVKHVLHLTPGQALQFPKE